MNFDFIVWRGNVEDKEKLLTMVNNELIRELDALVHVLEEIRNVPNYVEYNGNNRLAKEILRLVDEDRVSMEFGILARMKELCERMDHIGFGDLVQLNCLLRSSYFEYRINNRKNDHGDVLSKVVSELREKATVVVVAVEVEKGAEIQENNG